MSKKDAKQTTPKPGSETIPEYAYEPESEQETIPEVIPTPESERVYPSEIEPPIKSPHWMSVIITGLVAVVLAILIWNGFQSKAISNVIMVASDNTENVGDVTTVANGNTEATIVVMSVIDSVEKRITAVEVENVRLKNEMKKLEDGRWNVQSGLNASHRRLFETIGYNDSTARVLANQLAITGPTKRDDFLLEIYNNAPPVQMTIDSTLIKQVQLNTLEAQQAQKWCKINAKNLKVLKTKHEKLDLLVQELEKKYEKKKKK